MPDPLHPAVVHLPIALALVSPLLAALVVLAIRARWVDGRGWALAVLLHGLLAGSAWLAVETGENEEERVEKVVAERHIEAHEEAAERLLILAGATFALSFAGFARAPIGGAVRIAIVAFGAGVAAAAFAVGHSGGELVYRHGAAAAYAAPPDGSSATAP